MTDAPRDVASALVQRVYALLVVTRERLIAMDATGATGMERQVYLALTSALEDGLRRTLEEAMATLKGMKAEAAEAWLRRLQLDTLNRPPSTMTAHVHRCPACGARRPCTRPVCARITRTLCPRRAPRYREPGA